MDGEAADVDEAEERPEEGDEEASIHPASGEQLRARGQLEEDEERVERREEPGERDGPGKPFHDLVVEGRLGPRRDAPEDGMRRAAEQAGGDPGGDGRDRQREPLPERKLVRPHAQERGRHPGGRVEGDHEGSRSERAR